MGVSDRPPAIYRAVYSPATVAAAVAIALAALAVSQAHVIRDWSAMLHPVWPVWATWAMAIGYEVGVVAVGLVLVSAPGDRRLWASETILVAASMAAAVDLALASGQPMARALVAAMLPVQYLAVILAGHHLAVTVDRRQRATAKVVTTPTVRPARAVPATNGHDPLAAYLAAVASVGQADADVAKAMGVSVRTARRYRTAAGQR